MTKANKRHELLTATCIMDKVARPVMAASIILQLATGKKIFAVSNLVLGSVGLGYAIGATAAMLKLNK